MQGSDSTGKTRRTPEEDGLGAACRSQWNQQRQGRCTLEAWTSKLEEAFQGTEVKPLILQVESCVLKVLQLVRLLRTPVKVQPALRGLPGGRGD